MATGVQKLDKYTAELNDEENNVELKLDSLHYCEPMKMISAVCLCSPFLC